MVEEMKGKRNHIKIKMKETQAKGDEEILHWQSQRK